MEINHYVAWMHFHGDKIARFQGISENEDEFRQMCEEKGFDLSEADEVECIKENARDSLGRPIKKEVAEW